MARRETPAQKGTAPPCPAGTAPGARPLSSPIQVPPAPKPKYHRCLQAAAGAAPRPPPHTGKGSPPSARARPAPTSSCGLPARRCGAVRGRGRLHPAAGRAAGAAPLASPRGQPQGGGMAAALPAVHGARGEGKGNEVNRIPRQEAFQGLPSAATPHSCLQSTPKPHLPPPQPSLRADTKESSGTSFCCLGTEINKSSLNLQLFPAILSRSCLERIGSWGWKRGRQLHRELGCSIAGKVNAFLARPRRPGADLQRGRRLEQS